MFFSFAYLALRALLGLLVHSRRGPDIKDIEAPHENLSAVSGSSRPPRQCSRDSVKAFSVR